MVNVIPPFSLAPFFSPRPWGTLSLAPWFPERTGAEPTGEAWLTGPESRVETGPLTGQTLEEVLRSKPLSLTGPHNAAGDYPLLIKLIFPTDKLSIQVHPEDAMARRLGGTRGKTECWYILHAEPGAHISLGLREGATKEGIRAAILDNTLEDWMVQVPVSAGDLVYVEHGTVHAIGPGVVIFEVQQQSDLTYRMYDYGRPRELHIEPALEAMRLTTPSGKVTPSPEQNGITTRIENPYFTLREHRFAPAHKSTNLPARNVPVTLVLLAGAAGVSAPELSTPLACKLAHAIVLPAGTESQITAEAGTRIMEIIPGPALFDTE